MKSEIFLTNIYLEINCTFILRIFEGKGWGRKWKRKDVSLLRTKNHHMFFNLMPLLLLETSVRSLFLWISMGPVVTRFGQTCARFEL